jgi:hypothetical protein
MDVDDEADLRTLALQDLRGTETGAWLQRNGWLERLKPELKLAANI